MKRPLLRLVAYLTGGIPVALKCYKGQTYYTIMYKDPWGYNYAHVYWITKTGHVICRSDGTTDGASTYIQYWKKI